MDLAQRRTGIDAQLVGERSAQLGVYGQRVGRASLPGEGNHQVGVQVLPPRPTRQHVGEHRSDALGAVRGTRRAELRRAPACERAEASFVPGGGRRSQVDAVDPVQGVAPPQREGPFGRGWVASSQQFVRFVGVQPDVVQTGAVADAVDRLDDTRQPAPKIGDDLVDLLAGGARRLTVPQGGDERVQRDGMAAGE